MTLPVDKQNQKLRTLARVYAGRSGDLLRYVRHRIKHDADARDIAQEAFLRFLRLEDPERVRNPDAYIFRIAGNLLWEKRLRQQEESGQPVQDEPAAEEGTALDVAASCQTAQRLRQALDHLPVMQRAVLLLHLRDGLSFAEIASHARISNTMAKKHFKNAVTACRELLKDLSESGGSK